MLQFVQCLPDICAALVVCQAAKLPSPRVPGPHVISDVKPPQPVPASPDQSCSSLAPPPLSRYISNISTAAGGGVWFTVRTSHAVRGFAICDDALRSEVCHHLVHQMLDYVVWMHRLNWRQQYVICAQATLRRKWVRNNAIFRHQSMQNVQRRTVRFNARGPPGWFLKCYVCYGKYKIVQEKL